MEVAGRGSAEAHRDGDQASTRSGVLPMQRQIRRMQLQSRNVPAGAKSEAVHRAQKRRRRAAKRATVIARAIWVLAHVLILAAIVFSRSQVHNDFDAGRPGPIVLAFFLVGINFWLYMWVSLSNPGVVRPPCTCAHSRTGCQHSSAQSAQVQASVGSENAGATGTSTRSLGTTNVQATTPAATPPGSQWNPGSPTPNRRESYASATTSIHTPTTWHTARVSAMDSPAGLAPFPHTSPHSYGRVPVTDDTDDERFHDGGAIFGPRIARVQHGLGIDHGLIPPSPLGSPCADRRASEESATISDSSTALQSKARSSSLPHRALDGIGQLRPADDAGGSSYMSGSPLAAASGMSAPGQPHTVQPQRPRPAPLDMLAFGRPSPRGPSPLGTSPTSSPHPPSRASPLPPPHLRGPSHPGPIAEATCEITPANTLLRAARSSPGMPGPVAEARIPHVATSAHVHTSAAKANEAALFSRRASPPHSMHIATVTPHTSDSSLGSSPTHQGFLPGKSGATSAAAASREGAAAAGCDQDVVRAAAAVPPLDVLHLGRVFAKNASRARLNMAADGGSDGCGGSSRMSSPKVAAAVAAVAAGALTSTSSLRSSASQSFRNREAMSTGAVTCGRTCVRGEWPLAHTVVVALQRGARSVGRWLTFFAGFRFDSVSVSGDDDEAVLLETDLMPQHAQRGRVARGSSSGGVRGLCGCICYPGDRNKSDDLEPVAGPVAEGRFGRGERGVNTSARDSRGQPSVVPEYGASLAGFGSDQMDLTGGMIGMELEPLAPQRQPSAAENPFVDFGLTAEPGHVFRGSSAVALPPTQRAPAADPLAQPLDLVDDQESTAGTQRRGRAQAVGKALRTAASRLGGGGSSMAGDGTSPERRQPRQHAAQATSPHGPRAERDTAREVGVDVTEEEEEEDVDGAQEPVVIEIPDEGEARAGTAGDIRPLERRSPFDDGDAAARTQWHLASRRASSIADSGVNAARRGDAASAAGASAGALGCITPDVRRAHLQRSLALSQRSLSRMSVSEAATGPPPDWYSTTNPGRLCPYCDLWQPLRAKHCHDCGLCVRRFDHHCAWIGNCVGEHNHRLFFAYLTAQLVLLTWAATQLVSAFHRNGDWEVWVVHQLHLLLAMLALLLFFLFVGGLWLYHVYLALTNQTTYEASFRDRVPYLKDLPEHHLPFSSSVIINLRQFCMPDPETVYTIKVGR
eukprot:jgi/Ulvmu1/3740/UM173_0013.1